jgi:hypothetical protein
VHDIPILVEHECFLKFIGDSKGDVPILPSASVLFAGLWPGVLQTVSTMLSDNANSYQDRGDYVCPTILTNGTNSLPLILLRTTRVVLLYECQDVTSISIICL